MVFDENDTVLLAALLAIVSAALVVAILAAFAFKNLRDQHNEASENILKSIDRAKDELVIHETRITAVSTELMHVQERLIQQEELFLHEFAIKLDPIKRNSDTLNASIEQLAEMANADRVRLLACIEMLNEAVGNISNSVAEASKSVSDVSNRISTVPADVAGRVSNDLLDALNELAKIVDDVSDKIVATTDETTSALTEVSSSIGTVRATFAEQNEQLTGITDALREVFAAWNAGTSLKGALFRALQRSNHLHQELTGLLTNTMPLAFNHVPMADSKEPVASELVQPAHVVWSPQLVDRFWQGIRQTRLNELSFARQNSGAITDIAKALLGPGIRVLDFGGGEGGIASAIKPYAKECVVFEPSIIENAERDDTLSYVSSLDECQESSFDLIVACEVIEHILPGLFPATMYNLRRLLKPAGLILISCPNDEDLDQGSAMDPVSGRLFHRWQHVRSLTHHGLTEAMLQYGFVRHWTATLSLVDEKQVAAAAASLAGAASAWKEKEIELSPDLEYDNAFNLLYVGGLREISEEQQMDPPAAERFSEWVRLSDKIKHVDGFCYSVYLPKFAIFADSHYYPNISSLVLKENEKEIGRPHALHTDIATQGTGLFSHWNDTLYFSASDGSDPRQNGRVYEVRIEVPSTV